uniref:Metalloendopeptidase n=1 Tax=Acrobeloides nanus TaxID=290746 RepID=A0A914E5X8_9BILA
MQLPKEFKFIKIICIKGCGDITIGLVKPIHFLESIMVSVKALAIVLSVLVICEAKWERASKQERRERFLQRFLEGNAATNFNQFTRVQNRLAQHRERFARKNRIVNPEEISAAQRIQKIRAQDKDKQESYDTISSINDAVKEFMYQNDITLTEEQADALTDDDDDDDKNRTKRQAQIGNGFPRNQWTVGQAIPYTFSSSISASTQALIRLAAQFWQDNTCLSFAENGAGTNRLYFNQGSGCYSYVGRVASASQQEVSIGQGCELFGIVTHEIGHALGFFHTMSRYDRDSYVSIQTQNIAANLQSQFNKETTATNNNYNVEYDYGSVMHYPEGKNLF